MKKPHVETSSEENKVTERKSFSHTASSSLWYQQGCSPIHIYFRAKWWPCSEVRLTVFQSIFIILNDASTCFGFTLLQSQSAFLDSLLSALVTLWHAGLWVPQHFSPRDLDTLFMSVTCSPYHNNAGLSITRQGPTRVFQHEIPLSACSLLFSCLFQFLIPRGPIPEPHHQTLKVISLLLPPILLLLSWKQSALCSQGFISRRKPFLLIPLT